MDSKDKKVPVLVISGSVGVGKSAAMMLSSRIHSFPDSVFFQK